ncbi:pyruvate dehydrogenase complex E1 component subunit beta [Devosia aurantiaca]|uniref:Pyruvate dehydrogenase E1 component subunit beta n=1 Tax=Devosia aurantiaca TaxID=2714858 RepID=A0A6M1SXZ1_9HYPH|nr:pyruvate dehydrogenase complex E1 component subunit beta [Devosia aurantiaca]NGP17611.1 pyruvate dehydrogenase complex E1 component subunit beta [Devosia aurantiaca]
MPQILMPALSPTMEEGKLAKWLVKVGDTVKSGDVLAEIETDKATMEVESVDEGVVREILIEEGTEGVKVNAPIAFIQGEGEEVGEGNRPAAQVSTSDPEKESPVVATTHAEPKSSSAEAPKFTAQSDPDLPEGVEMVEMTVRQALNEAMAEELRRDKDVFVMGEEVAQYQGAYKITQNLLEEFGPERIIDTPITEHGFAGLAVGAAFAGLKPIVEFMTWNFAMQAIDQIINSAAKQLYMSGGQVTAPMVFRGPNGAAARVGAQHSQDYSAWYSSVPGLTVIAPYSAADAKGLLKAAIRSPNPVVFLENEILYGSTGLVPKMDDFVLPIGKARIAREGKDVTIVSFSMGMRYATQATEKLVGAGVDVELIDLRTLRPLDIDTVIASVKKTGRLVTVEEGWPQNGIGADISARVMEQAFDYLDAPVLRVTGKDVPMPYAANLEKLALPNVDEVIAAVNAVTYRS